VASGSRGVNHRSIIDAVKAVVAATDVLSGKTRQALDSTVIHITDELGQTAWVHEPPAGPRRREND
jgi:hypothetical protein